jgi:hypothetical protein
MVVIFGAALPLPFLKDAPIRLLRTGKAHSALADPS